MGLRNMTLLIGESLDTEMFVRKHHTSRALNVEDTFNTTNPFVKRSLVYSGGTTRRCLRVEQLVASCKSAPRLSHREAKIRLLVEKGGHPSDLLDDEFVMVRDGARIAITLEEVHKSGTSN